MSLFEKVEKKRIDQTALDNRILRTVDGRIWPNEATKQMDKMVKTGFQPEEGRGSKKRKRK